MFNAGRERGACDPADSTERHVIISRDEITSNFKHTYKSDVLNGADDLSFMIY